MDRMSRTGLCWLVFLPIVLFSLIEIRPVSAQQAELLAALAGPEMTYSGALAVEPQLSRPSVGVPAATRDCVTVAAGGIILAQDCANDCGDGTCCRAGFPNCCSTSCCPAEFPVGCPAQGQCYRNHADAENAGCGDWEICGRPQ